MTRWAVGNLPSLCRLHWGRGYGLVPDAPESLSYVMLQVTSIHMPVLSRLTSVAHATAILWPTRAVSGAQQGQLRPCCAAASV
jgi:hypothetical protein